MLIIGPVSPEWIESSNNTWKKRFQLLRKAIPISRTWKSFFIKDSIHRRKTLVDHINHQTLTEIGNLFLDQNSIESLTDKSDHEDDTDNDHPTNIGPTHSRSEDLSILHSRAYRPSESVRFSTRHRPSEAWSRANPDSPLTSHKPSKRFSVLSYSRMTSDVGLTSIEPSGIPNNQSSLTQDSVDSTTPMLRYNEQTANDVAESEESDDDLEMKTHAQPIPILLGVPSGEASRSLQVIWDEPFSKSVTTNWRENMERLVAASSSPASRIPSVMAPTTTSGADSIASRPISQRPSVAAPSTISGPISTTRWRPSIVEPPPVSPRLSSASNLYNTVRSRGSTTSMSSFVTAHESLESITDPTHLTPRVSTTDTSDPLAPITSEESYDTAEYRENSLSPRTGASVSVDYASTIRPEPSSALRWTDPFEAATIEEESGVPHGTHFYEPTLSSWGPPHPNEMSEISDCEDSDAQSFETSYPIPIPIASRKSRPTILAERRSKLKNKVDTYSELPMHTPRRRRDLLIDMGFRRFLKQRKKGEVVRIEKLLVMVKGSKAKYITPEFNEVENLETRILERWKEYVVVARNTGNSEAPITLQFYNTRSIAKIEKEMTKSISKIDINLTSDMYVKFYSTLDKTIVLWRSTSKGSLLYILRARSHESSLRWLALFRRALGVKQSPHLVLGVPNLGVTVEIVLPLAHIMREQSKHAAMQKEKQLINYQDMKSRTARSSPILSYIFTSVIEGLSGIDRFKNEVLDLITKEKMGLAWRRYDRLEWVDEANEEGIFCSWVLRKTHDLEFRPKKAYPTIVTFEDGMEMEEPVPVEGYLVRLTTWSGHVRQRRTKLSKLFYKKLYFHSHDNILFFSQPSNAVPPHPSNNIADFTRPSQDSDNVPPASPLIYEVAPFKTDENGEIEWLNGNNNEEEVKRHDRAALYEIQRRVSMIVSADGFIDLCEIDCVRKVVRDFDGADEFMGTENEPQLLSCFTSDSSSSGEVTGYPDDFTFEIVMLSGLVIRLMAYNESLRDLWIQKLTELAKYWKRRVYEDVARINEVRQANLERLHVDEDMEPFVGEANPKWETSSGVADPSVYHISRMAWSRSISMRGILYQKANKHATFRRYYVILCHGHLILYSVYYRTATGDAKHRVDHRRYQSIKLQDSCYVYSGPITQGDLLIGRDKLFDRTNPGSHSIPRVYPDGWKSAEEEPYRCFVLWFGKKRPITSNSSNEKKVKLVNRLGVQGISMVFLARSRQERDLWVLALNNEIERAVPFGTQDINIVS